MKRALSLFCIVVAVLFGACKKDNENDPLMVKFVNKSGSMLSNLKVGSFDIGSLPQSATTEYFQTNSIQLIGNSAQLDASGNVDVNRTINNLLYCGVPPTLPPTTLRNGKHTIYIRVSPTMNNAYMLTFEVE